MNLLSLEIEEGSIGDKIEIIFLEHKNTLQKLLKKPGQNNYVFLVGLDKGIRREFV